MVLARGTNRRVQKEEGDGGAKDNTPKEEGKGVENLPSEGPKVETKGLLPDREKGTLMFMSSVCK